MTEHSVLIAGLILSIASIVAMLCHRLRLPYSVGLVLAGIGLALSPYRLDLPLSRELIFTVFLPPLIFEASLHLKWRELARDLPVTMILAFPGVAIATAAVYPLCALFALTPLRVTLKQQHVLFWGGLRGALALALALALPAQIAERQEIILVAFAVVAFSIFVQGLTMPLLMRRLQPAPPTGEPSPR